MMHRAAAFLWSAADSNLLTGLRCCVCWASCLLSKLLSRITGRRHVQAKCSVFLFDLSSQQTPCVFFSFFFCLTGKVGRCTEEGNLIPQQCTWLGCVPAACALLNAHTTMHEWPPPLYPLSLRRQNRSGRMLCSFHPRLESAILLGSCFDNRSLIYWCAQRWILSCQ